MEWEQAVSEAVERRRREREVEKLKEHQKLQLAEQMQETVKSIISSWKRPKGYVKDLGLAELLQSLPTILPDLVPAGAVCGPGGQLLNSASTPGDVSSWFLF
jgi:hypothetical protein